MRTNRHVLRLIFLVVILMALFGGWWADRSWQAATSNLQIDVSTETDWISLLADFAENSMKFFQGASSAAS